MCNPAAALGGRLAMTAFSHISAHNAKVEEANRQNDLYIRNANNARVAATDDQRALNRRALQESQATADKKFRNQIEMIALREKKKTAQLEKGKAGASVNAILRDVQRKGSFNAQTLDRNMDMVLAQIEDQKHATKSTFMNRVNSVQKAEGPDIGDSMLGMAVDMGTQVAGSYLSYAASNVGTDVAGPVMTGNPTAPVGTGTVLQTTAGNAAAPQSYTDWLFTKY